jgi:hypothetical protein
MASPVWQEGFLYWETPPPKIQTPNLVRGWALWAWRRSFGFIWNAASFGGVGADTRRSSGKYPEVQESRSRCGSSWLKVLSAAPSFLWNEA